MPEFEPNQTSSQKQMILRKEEIVEKYSIDESQTKHSWPFCLKLQF